ncbi:MAG: DUF111 family protein [Leptolyngbyaceae cyanobacterium SM2_5_2]|nr:DUF111 family protein [Leptolyngbyaceae cyanobacterium SM2_5_2]
MKTIAYLDCPTGISGDMCLGAVLDAGVPLSYLQTHLAGLGLNHEFSLTAAPTHRQGLRALKAEVTLIGTAKPPAQNQVGNSHHGHFQHPHSGEHHAHPTQATLDETRPPPQG